MSKKEYQYRYDGEPIPPGQSVWETADFYGITKRELAARTGRPEEQINSVIEGNMPITEELALALERVLGMNKECLLRFEKVYQQQKIERANKEKIQSGLPILETKAVQELKKRNVIITGTPQEEINAVLNFYKVDTVDMLLRLQNDASQTALRHKQGQQSDKLSLIAWLRMCEDTAVTIESAVYNKGTFFDAVKSLCNMTTESPEDFLPKLVQICAGAGVAVVCVPEFPHVYVKGAAKWLTVNKAMIALTLYENVNDVFWFTFFHEAAHILLDKRKHFLSDYAEITDNISNTDDVVEKKVNRFAENRLIPSRYKRQLKRLATRQDICDFADKIGVAPGIVVGRLQHEEIIQHEEYNDLKQNFKWSDQ